MSDTIFDAWLKRQLQEGCALADASDLLQLAPMSGDPPRNYLARFRCTGLVRDAGGAIRESNEFVVGVSFPASYLRCVDPGGVVSLLAPHNVWHPNVTFGAPFICLGHLAPGTSLVDLLYQVFEIITYSKVAMHDALNHDAAAWARGEDAARFPVDRRPLKRPTTLVQSPPQSIGGGHAHVS